LHHGKRQVFVVANETEISILQITKKKLPLGSGVNIELVPYEYVDVVYFSSDSNCMMLTYRDVYSELSQKASLALSVY